MRPISDTPHPPRESGSGDAPRTGELADVTIRRLQASLHERLDPCFTARAPYALLDYPDHRNIGDHAIWLGELAFLHKRLRRPPAYVCSRRNLDASALRRLPASMPLLLHGGGNFGDLWPDHQQFREDVLCAFPDRPIIQLPQSIHFTSPERVAQAQRVISHHRDFTLFVRDEQSLAFARNSFDCPVSLCPDMAFALGRQKRPRPPSRDALLLLRTDKERIHDHATLDNLPSSFGQPADWVTLDQARHRNRDPLIDRAKMRLLRHTPFVSENFKRRRTYRHRSTRLLRDGLAQIADARCIITDRLHVHILSLLLDIPHVCLDNNYGKISQFRHSWTASYRDGRQATSLADAVRQAQQLLQARGV